MAEASLWQYLKNGMKDSGWDATRHEDKMTIGVPDISFGLNMVNGWIELKALYGWPKNPATKVKFGLSEEQVWWINNRNKKGGHCFIFVRIKRDYLLIDGMYAVFDGKYTKKEWMDFAAGKWVGSVNFNEFIDIILK